MEEIKKQISFKFQQLKLLFNEFFVVLIYSSSGNKDGKQNQYVSLHLSK